MLLPLLFTTFGTAYFSQLTLADGIVKVIDIELYWDEECTSPVFSVDFGMLERGQSKSVAFWLKNNSTDKGRISWGSENYNPSSNGITQCWERKVGRFRYISNWNKKVKPGDLWKVHYTIQVAQDIQDGAYSWDLIVRYNPSHSSLVMELVVHCSLTVTQ